MFFLTHKALQAFSRARLHPEDAGVLLVDNPEGLAAINLPGIKAVIWERDMPKDVRDILKRTDGGPTMTTEEAPKAFAHDMKRLKRIFKRAVPRYTDLQTFIIPYTRPEVPHQDSINRRIVTVYTTNPAGGTLWYPGDFSWQEVNDLREKMKNTADRDALKRAYRCQMIPPGHILALKGENSRSFSEDLLVHSGQIVEGRQRVLCMVNSL